MKKLSTSLPCVLLLLFFLLDYRTDILAQNYPISDTTIITCGGYFWDDGLAQSYSDSSYTITFQSASGRSLVLNFYQFSLVPNTGSYLFVYDGPDETYPSLGTFGENAGYPVSIISTGPYLTIRKHIAFPPIPPTTQDFGWKASIGCLGDPEPVFFRGLKIPVLSNQNAPKRSNIAVADTDNDGDPDMLIRDTLYRNDTPTDTAMHISERRNSFGPWNNASPAVADFDLDGDLDVFICGWYGGINSSASRSVLFEQTDVDKFKRVSFSFMPASEGTATAVDWDNDGDADIAYTGNGTESRVLRFYRNDGNFSFTDVTPSGEEGARSGGMDWNDVDNDGDLDFVIGGITDATAPGLRLGMNNGNSQFSIIPLYDVTYQRMDVHFFDYDTDGDKDLYVGDYYRKIYINTAGTFEPLPDTIDFPFAMYNFSHFYPQDYDGDGDEDALLTGFGTFKLYRNEGNAHFTDVTVPGAFTGEDTGAAWGDFDQDGRLDFFVQGLRNQESAIFFNRGNSVFEKYKDHLSGYLENARCIAANFYGDNTPEILCTGLQFSCYLSGTPESHIFEITNNKTSLNKYPVFKSAAFFPGLSNYGMTIWQWGDYNNDGYQDLMLHDLQTPLALSKVTIFRNNGNNSFSQVLEVDGGSYFTSTHWVDFDTDGDLDIYIGRGQYPNYYRNNGNNAFVYFQPANPVYLWEGSGFYRSAEWADLDLDGDKDMIESWSTSLRSYLNDGAGNLTPYSGIAPFDGERIAIGDFSNDGIPDCLSYTSGYTGVFENCKVGGQLFGKMRRFDRATVADFNDDGLLDYAASVEYNFEQVQLAVWLNQGNYFFRPDTLDLTHIFWFGSDYSAIDYDLDGDLDIANAMPVVCEGLAFAQNMSDQARRLHLAFPNGGEQVLKGQQVAIEWNGHRLHDNGMTQVSISYSLDGGVTFTALGEVPTGAESGSFLWDVPDVFSRQCLVRINSNKNDVSDQSDFYFEITDHIGSSNPLVNAVSFLVFPNPALHEFQVKVYEDWGGAQIQLWNVFGQIVFSKIADLYETNEPVRIPTLGLPCGNYFLQLKNGERIEGTQVVIGGVK